MMKGTVDFYLKPRKFLCGEKRRKIMTKPFKDLFNDKTRQDSISVFHVHIYFDPGTQSETDAAAVSWALKRYIYVYTFPPGQIGAIGPHTKPNFEVDISARDVAAVIAWLQKNGRGLSTLIHPRSGDEIKDHFDDAIWLGKPVPLNEAFFKRWKAANDKKGPKFG